ncbi:low specificity L-threonine aldolase [Burkholderia sp. Ac-20353]|uniref:threonine aldolase family protein n=1 Tax=Burkholderia sp. Ac-20353 TaxID=2703894 RepID=UPI00197BBF88|nr:low specificity L-threonine aldolase [Burkholderia sp. Ac-20353]MBN3786411.1 low specificity L-threonine aldolase [Burkholderia sp. Ac-20353]
MKVTKRSPALNFKSDNVAGASPEVIDAILACNSGQANPYGGDDYTARVVSRFSEIFERQVDVFLVSTGTAANAISLSAMTPPWGKVFCHPESHINTDECGAPEFYTHGAKLALVDGPLGKIEVAKFREAARFIAGDIHTMKPSCLSITQATEVGSVYTREEIGALGQVCRESDLKFHMDGSRFANALVSLGCSPAELTWKAGVDALSFGATKNGVLAAEAIVLFNRALAPEVACRRKRGGHLFSKMRFLSAQMDAYLADDLWLRNARNANDMAHRLGLGLREMDVEILGGSGANIVFCRLPASVIESLLREGVEFIHDRWGPNVVRFVTSFATTSEDIDCLLSHLKCAST